MPKTRVRISVLLDSDVVDRQRERAAYELEAATVAYYESLTPEERREEQAMASASSRSARGLSVDT